MPKNKNAEENYEEEFEQWDIKRIIVGILTVAILIGGFVFFVLPYISVVVSPQVLGAFDKKVLDDKKQQLEDSNVSEDINNLVSQAQKELAKLKPDTVASQTAELQKILNDIKSLQEKKKAPQDIFCEYVCKK